MTACGIGGILPVGQQVIRTVEGNEALGMLRRREDGRGMLDAHRLVPRRMHDQQCLAQIGDTILECLTPGIVHQLLADLEACDRRA